MWKAIIDAMNGNAGLEEKSSYKTIDFNEMKKIVGAKNPNVILVDVREPSEYEVVNIPGSINVPYKSHPHAFELSDADFKKTVGIAKPSADKEIVFFCAAGMRAVNSRELAAKNGYRNTAVYKGSMNDWVANGGDKLQF